MKMARCMLYANIHSQGLLARSSEEVNSHAGMRMQSECNSNKIRMATE